MPIEHNRVLAEISKNVHTMLVISREGTIVRTEALDASASVEQMAEMTRANHGSAVVFLSRRNISEGQLHEIIASSARERWGMRLVIADAPDKEELFAELYYDGEIWAIVSQEQGPLFLEIQGDPRLVPMKFDLEDVLDIFLQAKRKLSGGVPTEKDPK